MYWWLAVVAAVVSISGYGQSVPHVPEQLEDWRGWVVHGQEYRRCPFLYNSAATARGDFVCAWPGQLELTVTAEGGYFKQLWTIYGEEQWAPLPGDAEVWPRTVMLGGRPGKVVLHQDAPAVRLPPGRHRITGAFAWAERPPTLAVPPESGLLALTVDGERVASPRRRDGQVWLADGERGEAVKDQLAVEVYRRIEDEVPTRLLSVFRVDVAGSVREERIGPALPDGFVPLSLTSELAARLEPDGNLRVQARPGSWEIIVVARATEVLARVTLSEPEHGLRGPEIWSYQANPRLRATLPEASQPVDPALVGARWRNLPAFRMRPGESLAIVEHSRGKAITDNALRLRRTLWLDFDGGGFIFVDEIGGVMRGLWRLNMAAPYTLLSAAEQGQNLLVTRAGGAPDGADLAGIEVRHTDLDLEALGRIETRDAMPVIGWRTGVDDVSATLNLPPGRKLAVAFGVDGAPSSWVGRWRLLDFFLLLIVTVATTRLFGRAAGAVALLALALSFHEPGAPVWTWLNLLAAAALARVAPPGRLLRAARGYRLTSFAILLVLLIPFATEQLRVAVYPQLEPESHRKAWSFGLFETLSGEASVPSHAPPGPPALERAGAPRPGEGVRISRASESSTYDRYGDRALVQTGPGKPAWDWAPHPLSWSGPVDADRAMRLVILPVWLVSALRFITVASLGLLAAWFAFDVLGRSWRWSVLRRGASAATAALLAVGLLVTTEAAQATTPSPEILRELERRLLKPPPCTPACMEIVNANVLAGERELTMQLDVHALAEVAVPMPGSAEGWWPERVAEGKSTLPGYRDQQGVLWVQLAAGRHTLTLGGPLPPGERLEIPFPASPRVIAARSDHWFIAGIRDGTLSAGALVLTRLREDAAAAVRWEASRFPVFVRVVRTIDFGIDWRLTTRVHRVAPKTGALNVELPLLAGESILSGEYVVNDGRLLVSMSPTQETFAWNSSLPRQPTMTLRAPPGGMALEWREIWRFAIGSAWQVDFDGVPESLHQGVGTGRVAAFHPRPGESLEIRITRPEAVAGETLAFDKVDVDTVVGAGRRDSKLTLDYRSTRGGSHRLQLPPMADLESVAIDGVAEPLVAAAGVLNVPILPGEHQIVASWTETATPGMRVNSARVDLGAPSGNLVSSLSLPANRWLLFTAGPTLGPAVLYWSELLALIAAALILGRFRLTPLRTHHWLLLGLGFSTFSWLALAVVVAWLLVHGARKSRASEMPRLAYNTSQIAFAMLTLAAFAAILIGVPTGLLGHPDMHVAGFQSTGQRLSWFADQAAAVTPEASAWSLPLWTYKALILAWALWLSFALVRWLPWVWECFSGSGLWRQAQRATSGETA